MRIILVEIFDYLRLVFPLRHKSPKMSVCTSDDPQLPSTVACWDPVTGERGSVAA
jgi:hypothetical protein